MKRSFIVLFLITIFSACQTSEIAPDDSLSGVDYFGLKLGAERYYSVRKIEHIFFPRKSDTLFYELKEVLADTFINLEGNIAYRMERFKRPNSTADWIIDSVWTSDVHNRMAIRTENNVPYVKLIFPINKNATWNGNLLNPYNDGSTLSDNYRIISIGLRYSVQNYNFDNTLFVEQQADSNCVLNDSRFEVYQKGIGLVHKFVKRIAYDQSVICGQTPIISNGYEYQEILTDAKNF